MAQSVQGTGLRVHDLLRARFHPGVCAGRSDADAWRDADADADADADTDTDTKQSGTDRFMIAKSSELPEELRDCRVQVKTTVGNRLLTDVHVGRSGEFTLLIPHQDIRICTPLPKGWSSEDAVADGPSGDFRWVRPARGEDVVITRLRLEG